MCMHDTADFHLISLAFLETECARCTSEPAHLCLLSYTGVYIFVILL